MFGLEDTAVAAAYGLSLVSALLCAAYGIINWNRGNDREEEQIREELAWQAEETQIDEDL